MKLELRDSFTKRAWVAMAWDTKSRKDCWEFVDREDFDDPNPTFYLTHPGVYCVSGDDPAKDRCRWLVIHDHKYEWCEYHDVAHLVSAGKSKRTQRGQAIEHTINFCCQCHEPFVTPKGSDPGCAVVGWTENNEPICEPFCESCAEAREEEMAFIEAGHSHTCAKCRQEFNWKELPLPQDCYQCQMSGKILCHSCETFGY